MSGSAGGGTVWIQTVGSLVLLAAAVLSAARLVEASRAAARPDPADGADVLMGLGMAATLWPLGNPVPTAAGVLTFGLVACGTVVAAVWAAEPGRRVTWVGHAAGGAAMALMFAMPMGVAWTVVTWALGAGFAVLELRAAWSALAPAAGVAAVAGPAQPAPSLVLAPPVTCPCHLVMAVGMVSLLLLMG